MRTTLILDPDVSQRIEQEARQKGASLDSVVNEVLRAGFGMAGDRPVSQSFRVQPHDFGFRPGLDLDKMNQLVDELEADELSRKLGA
ncbi:MAG TPA: antitoxin [Thermoanaerobaculia bacterium]|nr:antitoxin [Thermoanaerobaculia bacterium]